MKTKRLTIIAVVLCILCVAGCHEDSPDAVNDTGMRVQCTDRALMCAFVAMGSAAPGDIRITAYPISDEDRQEYYCQAQVFIDGWQWLELNGGIVVIADRPEYEHEKGDEQHESLMYVIEHRDSLTWTDKK